MLQKVIIFTVATIVRFISTFSSSLHLTTTIATTIFALSVLLLLVTPTGACPPSCECIDTSVLEVSCKDGRLLNIFTQIDNTTYSLSLDNVVDIRLITEALIKDLRASEIVRLKITSSSVKEIEENAFLKLALLEDLDLSVNELAIIHANSFGGLGDLKSLNLSHNQLVSLEQSLTLLPKLVTLDLSANSLKDFPPKLFSSQNSLTFLKLDGNPLRNLQGSTFEGLSSLRELRARDCSLTYVEDEVFSAMPMLSVIDLGQNRLTAIPSSLVLSKLIALRLLYLESNEIEALHSHMLEDVHLQTVNLSYNRISKIDSFAFHKALLSSLDLSVNLIISLNRTVLKPLGKHLTHLNLARNPLRQLQNDVFEDLKLLETLNVSFCSLENLEHNHIKNLPVLRKLDVSHNNLHFLPQSVLDLFDKLDTVSLHTNAWVCDCRIKFLRDWLSKASSASKLQCTPNHEGHIDCTNLRCIFPSELQNSQIILLRDQELALCQHEKSTVLPASTQGAIVASCLGFAVILLIVTILLWRRGKTHHGLKRVCLPSEAESSHVVDEDSKVSPLANCDRHSLTLSDHNFVFRHYFDHLIIDPKLIADGGENEDGNEEDGHNEGDSLYSSQPSLYSHHSDAGYGMESTV